MKGTHCLVINFIKHSSERLAPLAETLLTVTKNYFTTKFYTRIHVLKPVPKH